MRCLIFATVAAFTLYADNKTAKNTGPASSEDEYLVVTGSAII